MLCCKQGKRFFDEEPFAVLSRKAHESLKVVLKVVVKRLSRLVHYFTNVHTFAARGGN